MSLKPEQIRLRNERITELRNNFSQEEAPEELQKRYKKVVPDKWAWRDGLDEMWKFHPYCRQQYEALCEVVEAT